MKFFQRLLLLAAGITAMFPPLCGGQTIVAGEECQQLVRTRCATCHFVTYICPKIEKEKGLLFWKGIVRDMVREGLVATEQEQHRLVRCLANPDEKVRALCVVK